MLMTVLVVMVVSAALIAGALWGIYGKISGKTEGFVIALAGGALVVSLVSEMIQPAIEQSNLWVGLGSVAAGALILSAAAIIGNIALEGVSPHVLAATRCFAAGAVVASLATEVFPKAYKEDHHMAGAATAIGVILAVFLGDLGGG